MKLSFLQLIAIAAIVGIVVNGQCQAGTYKTNTTNSTCEPCDPSCLTCSGASATDCTSCKAGLVLYNGKCAASCGADMPYTFQGYCIPRCPDGTYPAANGVCTECDPSCLTCSAAGANSCTSCRAPNNLTNGQCTFNCSAGQYKDIALNKCVDRCSNGTFLFENQCITTCPNDYYFTGDGCNRCYTAKAIAGNECLVKCPPQTYSDSNYNCLACDSSCETCTAGDAKSCLTCASGFSYQGGLCTFSCSKGQFYDTVAKKCVTSCANGSNDGMTCNTNTTSTKTNSSSSTGSISEGETSTSSIGSTQSSNSTSKTNSTSNSKGSKSNSTSTSGQGKSTNSSSSNTQSKGSSSSSSGSTSKSNGNSKSGQSTEKNTTSSAHQSQNSTQPLHNIGNTNDSSILGDNLMIVITTVLLILSIMI